MRYVSNSVRLGGLGERFAKAQPHPAEEDEVRDRGCEGFALLAGSPAFLPFEDVVEQLLLADLFPGLRLFQFPARIEDGEHLLGLFRTLDAAEEVHGYGDSSLVALDLGL